jgi:hypothetical protein
MHRVRACLNWSDRTGELVVHAPTVRRIQTDTSGPTNWSTKFGSRMRRRGHARCPPVSSHVGLGPAWQRLNGRSKASRAASPSAASPIASIYVAALAACCAARRMVRPLQCRHFGLRASIQCLEGFLSRPSAASSYTPTLPSSPPFFSTQPQGPWSEALDQGEGG